MRATAALLFLVLAGPLAGCEADPGPGRSGDDGNPYSPAGNPRKPNAPTAMNANPFDPQDPQAPGPDEQTANPFRPGAKGGDEEDDDEAGFGLPGGLAFYYCSCLEPGGIVPTVGFYACASNPFEAANYSTLKFQCINVGRCISCVCFPGAPCLVKG